MSALVSSGSIAGLGCIICPNQSCLILSSSIFCLAERKATITTHSLHGSYFFDCLLESLKERELIRDTLSWMKGHRNILFLTRTIVGYIVLLEFLCNVIR